MGLFGGSSSKSNTTVNTSADTQILGAGQGSQTLLDSTLYSGSVVDNSQRTTGDTNAAAGGDLNIYNTDADAVKNALEFAAGNSAQTIGLVNNINAFRASEVEMMFKTGAGMVDKTMAFNSETTQKTNDGLRAAFAGANGVATNANLPYYLAGAALLVVLYLVKGKTA